MDGTSSPNVFELERTDDGQFYQAVRHAIVSVEIIPFIQYHGFPNESLSFTSHLSQMAMLVSVVLYMVSYVIVCRIKRPHVTNASKEGTVTMKSMRFLRSFQYHVHDKSEWFY